MPTCQLLVACPCGFDRRNSDVPPFLDTPGQEESWWLKYQRQLWRYSFSHENQNFWHSWNNCRVSTVQRRIRDWIGFSDWTNWYGGDYFHLQHPTWFKGDPDVKRTTVDFIVTPFRSVVHCLISFFTNSSAYLHWASSRSKQPPGHSLQPGLKDITTRLHCIIHPRNGNPIFRYYCRGGK